MVISCSAYACTNKWSRDSPIHFHKYVNTPRSHYSNVLNLAHKFPSIHSLKLPPRPLNSSALGNRPVSTRYRFPFRSRKMCEHWVRALKRKDFVPTRASLVCSDHFREEDYVSRPGLTKRMLKKDAVPSIFNFPVPGIRSPPSPYFECSQNKKEKKLGNPSRRKELVDLNNYDSVGVSPL